jgi:hypothetical protein
MVPYHFSTRFEKHINMFMTLTLMPGTHYLKKAMFYGKNIKLNTISQLYCLSFEYSSTCFGHPHARNMLSCIQTTGNKAERLMHLVS